MMFAFYVFATSEPFGHETIIHHMPEWTCENSAFALQHAIMSGLHD